MTPQDFGLTEQDVARYLKLRHKRREQLKSAHHMTLSADLQRRLDIASATSSLDSPVDEQTILELEAIMLYNCNYSD